MILLLSIFASAGIIMASGLWVLLEFMAGRQPQTLEDQSSDVSVGGSQQGE